MSGRSKGPIVELDYEAMYRRSAAAEELLRTQVQRLEARAEAAEAERALLMRALMGLSFPRTGDHGGPLVRITAHYEDGSTMFMGHEEPRFASEALQKVSQRAALSDTAQQETRPNHCPTCGSFPFPLNSDQEG